jgi:hypothetical protein
MRAKPVQAAVEALLGEAVSRYSIEHCLASNVKGACPRFVRVARGRYALLGNLYDTGKVPSRLGLGLNPAPPH